MKSRNSIDCVDVTLQSVVTYAYIGSRTLLFESDTTKSFLKNEISNPTRTLSNLGKPDR
jgi:hypothetical protein